MHSSQVVSDVKASGLTQWPKGQRFESRRWVEFWHQADILIIWNSIRVPPSSWVTRTCQCSRQGSVTRRGAPERLYTDNVHFEPAESGNRTPDRRSDTLHFYHLATVTGKNSTGELSWYPGCHRIGPMCKLYSMPARSLEEMHPIFSNYSMQGLRPVS